MVKNIAVIYHGGCRDGFGGAWAAYKKFGNKADYIPIHHQESPPDISGREIYFIDIIYNSLKAVKELIKNNKRVTAIDHHLTAKKNIKLTQDYSFDLKHSGAVLAWQYFYPKKPVPTLIKYIEDSDLWKFKLNKSKEITAYLEGVDFDFKLWDKLAKDFESAAKINKYVKEGKAVWNYQMKTMEKLVEEEAYMVEFSGKRFLAINAPHYMASDIGHLLYKKMPPMAIVWKQKKNDIKVSLRSDGSVNVGKIAAGYGGGGHRGAAGFKISVSRKLPWKVIK